MKIKPYFIEVETLDEYLDVCHHQSYYRQRCGADKDITHVWYITEYNLKPEDLNRWEVKKMFKNRPDIIDMIKHHTGELCKTTHGEIGIFRGVQLTNEDYYWIVDKFEDVENKTLYISCVSGCEPYKEFKPWNPDVDKLSSKLPGVLLNKPICILTKIEKEYEGELVQENGVVFFRSDNSLCIPTSEIAAYHYK